jgi:hypothetical protein
MSGSTISEAESVVARMRELRDQWALASTSIHESLEDLARIETYRVVVANLDIALESNGSEVLARLRAAQAEAVDAAEAEASETIRAEDAEAELAALKAGLGTERRTLPAGIDLSDADAYFVLTTALAEFAAEQRHQAANDPDTAKQRSHWAALADDIRHRIEEA